jgi:N-acetylmuramoyl-L-alanine amidase
MYGSSGRQMQRFVSGSALAMALLGAASLPATAIAGAYLHSATLDSESGSSAVVLGLSAPVAARVYTLEKPHRVVIDLPAVQGAAGFRLPAPRDPVTAIRGASRGAEGYRLVLELPKGAAAPQLAAATGSGGRQLRIWLAGAPAVAPPVAPAVLAIPPASTVATPVVHTVQPKHAPGREGRDIIIAVDAGHGGEDPGAIGPGGTHEKDVTLAIARALAARLNDRPGMKAILTRDSDRRIDLRERFERARHAGADLFVSIHADSIRDRSITGASVYTLSTHGASSEAAKRLADRENATVLKGGISLADVDPNLRSVLLDASQSQIMGQSVEAADAVLSALDQVGGVRKSVVQHAGFMVLKSPDQPSMLVETAYISNPAEERNLRSGSYQQRLAEAIETGVTSYFRQHPPDGTSYASARGPEARLPDDSGV